MNDRSKELARFVDALWVAIESMPGGYPEASQDRNAFVGPVEQVIAALEQELAHLRTQ